MPSLGELYGTAILTTRVTKFKKKNKLATSKFYASGRRNEANFILKNHNY
jgi:hypothetical protein